MLVVMFGCPSFGIDLSPAFGRNQARSTQSYGIGSRIHWWVYLAE
jgi:hypothetical protein